MQQYVPYSSSQFNNASNLGHILNIGLQNGNNLSIGQNNQGQINTLANPNGR